APPRPRGRGHPTTETAPPDDGRGHPTTAPGGNGTRPLRHRAERLRHRAERPANGAAVRHGA
ncbi:hypothetical protein, partial [Streptomyces sp. NPDC006132]|uniref:hypothetical protein n=1 Tax=Streptomyces sp. NPDC006132 TaxID=3156732 RepID=UPI0033DDDF21